MNIASTLIPFDLDYYQCICKLTAGQRGLFSYHPLIYIGRPYGLLYLYHCDPRVSPRSPSTPRISPTGGGRMVKDMLTLSLERVTHQ